MPIISGTSCSSLDSKWFNFVPHSSIFTSVFLVIGNIFRETVEMQQNILSGQKDVYDCLMILQEIENIECRINEKTIQRCLRGIFNQNDHGTYHSVLHFARAYLEGYLSRMYYWLIFYQYQNHTTPCYYIEKRFYSLYFIYLIFLLRFSLQFYTSLVL